LCLNESLTLEVKERIKLGLGKQVHHDPEKLLEKYARQQKEIADLRDRLKTILAEALNREGD
jgi:type I restriction-modification system DNA methylase subunit